jgi:hypothetical protein
MRAFRAARWVAALLVVSMSAPLPALANGALAIGACGAYGYARGYATPRLAEAAALAKCHGKNCRVVGTAKRACMAFAVEFTNPCGAYGYASGGPLAQVQNQALRECYRNGGRDCVIRTFACD